MAHTLTIAEIYLMLYSRTIESSNEMIFLAALRALHAPSYEQKINENAAWTDYMNTLSIYAYPKTMRKSNLARLSNVLPFMFRRKRLRLCSCDSHALAPYDISVDRIRLIMHTVLSDFFAPTRRRYIHTLGATPRLSAAAPRARTCCNGIHTRKWAAPMWHIGDITSKKENTLLK